MLARNGTAPLGDLRYLADTKLDDLGTPIAKAQIAAALGMLGDRTRAERVYKAALDDLSRRRSASSISAASDYGSTLRDAAALVTLAARRRRAAADDRQRGRAQSRRRGRCAPYTSTQENAWMVLAARALAKDAGGMSLDVAGEQRKGALYRSFTASELAAAAEGHQHRRRRRAGGGLGHRRAADAGARGRQGLQDRAALLHARRRATPIPPR